MKKCNLLCLSQRKDLIRISEIIPREMGHVSSITRKKSKIKIIPVEIVAYKGCTRWGLEKRGQWVEHLLGWILAQVSHFYISLAAYSWLAPLQNRSLQKKVVFISLSGALERKLKWQKEWRKGTWVSGEGVKLWCSASLSSPRATLDCFTKYLHTMLLQTAQPEKGMFLGLYTPEINVRNSV